MNIVLAILGWFCIFYFLGIILFAGHGTNFFLIWLVLGILALGLSFCIGHGIWQKYVPLIIRRVFWCLFGIGAVIFVIIEGLILSGFGAKPTPNAGYMIILGAQMKQDGPSKVLQYRLDAAVSYLEEYPDCKVIVSGGQGSDEHISEAQGMKEYLVEHGVKPERIQMEDQSKNTAQNLVFSTGYLDKEKDEIVIVTNNFHIFRALGIAGNLGYRKVSGLAAGSYPYLLPNNMLREFVGVWKDLILHI